MSAALQWVRSRPATSWRRAGAGDLGFSDILAGSADAQASWGQVQAQIQAEGAAGFLAQNEMQNALTAAKGNFQDSYNQLNAIHADATQIIGAAGQYALQAQSVLGAAQNVVGFIQAASNPEVPPQALVQSFTGIVVGIAAAAGAVSAGVGAAICAGVALAVEGLSALGVFPAAPSGVTPQGCDASLLVPQNNDGHVLVVGCTAGNYGSPGAARVPGPQDPRWRAFPLASTPWFIPVSTPNTTLAQPIQWGGGAWGSGRNGPRMIDAAYPAFRHLECEAAVNYAFPGIPAPAQDFCRAYFTAWKLNAALRLNGQSGASDADVLKQLVVQWNRAHASTGTFSFPDRGIDTAYMSSPGIGGDAVRNCGDVIAYGPYVGYLVEDIGGTLAINTGALKNPPNVATITHGIPPGAVTSTAATTAAKVSVALGAGALVAVGIYAVKEKIGYVEAAQRLYDKAAGALRRR